jgi:hypothetical protein
MIFFVQQARRRSHVFRTVFAPPILTMARARVRQRNKSLRV